MKIEIKRLTVNHRLSEETLAFACDIYVDGVKVGDASNHGTGGNTNVSFRDPMSARRDDDMFDRVRQYAEETLVDGVRWSSGDNAGKLVEPVEQLIDSLVYAEDERKQKERTAKKIAKLDASEKARNAARGYGTVRWTCERGNAIDTRWIGYKPGTDPKLAADQLTTKYAKGGKVTWEVVP